MYCGFGPGGIESDPERLVQAIGEDGGLLGLAVGAHAAKHPDLARLALGQEDVAVGRGPQQAGIVEPGGIQVHLEALGRLRPGIRRARNDQGAVVDRLIGRGRRKIGHGQMAAYAGRLMGRVGKGSLAGEHGRLTIGCQRSHY